MNNNASKIIKNIVINAAHNDENFQKEIVESYLELSFAAIEFYFKGRKFLIKSGTKTKEMQYEYDLYSILKLLDVRKEMLTHGVDLFYSLYALTNDFDCEYGQKYEHFISSIGIFKLNENKNEKVQELNEINELVKKYIINYYNTQ